MRARRSRHAVLAVLAAAAGLTVAITGAPAGAAVVNQTMSCGIGGNQTMKVDGRAPATVVKDDEFTVDLEPQAAKADGGSVGNMVWSFQIPTGATLVAGSPQVVGTGTATGGTMGTITTAATGTVVQLKATGTVASGATMDPPTLRFKLKATGAAGTTLSMKVRQSGAYALRGAGVVNVSCDATGALASFTSTVIQAPVTTTTSTSTTTTAPTTTSTSTTSTSTTTSTPGSSTTSTSTTSTTAPTTTSTTGPTTTTTTGPPVTIPGTTTTWSPSGGCGVVTTTVVPANVHTMTVVAAGAAGGKGRGVAGATGANGANGGQGTATFAVTPGQTISGVIGCVGTDGSTSVGNGGAGFSTGGQGGQGHGVLTSDHGGGAGGGSSAVCLGASCTGDAGSTPFIVAGGGGGGASLNCTTETAGTGGAGGGTQGATANALGSGPSGSNGGSGSGLFSGGGGGAGGVNANAGPQNGGNGGNGTGGAGTNSGGAGGGGGYVGGAGGGGKNGGCGGGGGGGGGSTWVATAGTQTTFATASSPAVTVSFTTDPTVVTTTSTSTTSTSTTQPTTTSTTQATTTSTTPPVCTADVAPFSSAGSLIDQQFADFLGRAPTANESAQWGTAINTCAQKAEDLIVSLLATDQTLNDARLVRLYEAFFKRPPDLTGFNYWTEQLAQGKGLIRTAQQFSESSEFVRTYGSLDNGAFVDLVYRNVLGRDAEPTGRAYWLAELNAKTKNRGDVMINFSESSENIRIKRPHVDAFRLARGMRQKFPTKAEHDAIVDPIVAETGTLKDGAKAIRLSAAYASRF